MIIGFVLRRWSVLLLWLSHGLLHLLLLLLLHLLLDLLLLLNLLLSRLRLLLLHPPRLRSNSHRQLLQSLLQRVDIIIRIERGSRAIQRFLQPFSHSG